MSNSGKIVLNKNGRQSILDNGSTAVFNAADECFECCCKPYTLASFTTSSGKWDLTPYRDKDGVAPPYRYWRIVNNYTGYVPIVHGCVDKNGRMVNLPASVSPDSYKYTWVFRLEIGCRDKTGNYIIWADGTRSNIYQC